jgi:phosphoenolpyruvate synthase/pyruvate phosphate dikinase
LSRKSCGIDDKDLNVAVLLMELVDAEFAFVVHTANPVTGDADEIFGEICVGLGETLVGNDAGSALGFTVSKSTGEVTLRSLPSKLCGHFAPSGGTVIARSDSNGEDLENFAGAGLYDSITAEPTQERVVDYTASSIVWNSHAREAMIRRISDIAKSVESYRGSPQDIEGAVVGDRIVLLQTRAQIC